STLSPHETPPHNAAPPHHHLHAALPILVGQKYGDIEVLDIDAVAGRVRINNSGTVMDLTFEKDAPKSNPPANVASQPPGMPNPRSEEHTSELQSRFELVCRLLLEEKNSI